MENRYLEEYAGDLWAGSAGRALGCCMDLRLRDYFDVGTLQRGEDYAHRGLVATVEPLPDGSIRGRVLNGRGESYQQRITLSNSFVDGICSCPVGHNCKHVVAVLMTSAERDSSSPQLAAPVRGWLTRVKQQPTALVPPEARPEDYPDKVKERLLYVLIPNETKVRIDIYKGRINAAGTGLNKAIRRYDALRSNAVAKFIRPTDLELLSALAQTQLWETHYSYGLPGMFKPKGQDALPLIRRLCDTGRFLHDNSPDAELSWSEACPKARLAWRMAADGSQSLGFEDADGIQLELRALDGAALWVNTAHGQIGALAQPVQIEALQLVQSAPQVAPDEAAALAAEMPATLAGLALPPPHVARQRRRAAHKRIARLTLGAESARDGYRRWDSVSVTLPTLTLRFVYDGQEVWEGDADPRVVENNER